MDTLEIAGVAVCCIGFGMCALVVVAMVLSAILPKRNGWVAVAKSEKFDAGNVPRHCAPMPGKRDQR